MWLNQPTRLFGHWVLWALAICNGAFNLHAEIRRWDPCQEEEKQEKKGGGGAQYHENKNEAERNNVYKEPRWNSLLLIFVDAVVLYKPSGLQAKKNAFHSIPIHPCVFCVSRFVILCSLCPFALAFSTSPSQQKKLRPRNVVPQIHILISSNPLPRPDPHRRH